MKNKILLLAIALLAFSPVIFAQADIKETIVMIQKNLASSKENLKNYEWIETTTTFLKGSQKSVKQNQCYYAVDGKLTKVETGGGTGKEQVKGGLRGKIIANKKEEMADYIKAAITKVQTYLPPEAGKVQQIYASGKSIIQILEPGKKFQVGLPDYNEVGDLLSISIDKVNQKIMTMAVNTYIDNPSQKVIFNITYNNLPDGTQYASSTTLDAQAKNLKIVIENSGFKKAPKK
jgi:hypothetical protein